MGILETLKVLNAINKYKCIVGAFPMLRIYKVHVACLIIQVFDSEYWVRILVGIA